MNLFKKKDVPHKESKEYLEKQQNIDLLLVLNNIVQVGSDASVDCKKLANKKIEKLLEEFNK